MLFVACLVAMLLAALGLAVGALRGRALPGGSCREGWLAGGMLPRCEVCPARRAPDRSGAPGGEG